MEEKQPVPILEMKNITKQFPGVLANEDVDLELFKGEVLALLGENGAGKSTLMNILSGLIRPDSGEIILNGKSVEINSPRDAMLLGIGMVHQNFKLVSTMTVAENIILGLDNESFVLDLKEVGKKISEISDHYNLKVDPGAYIWQMSVGEQQRVEILKLIYRGAEVLILDEPTAVLTPQESNELNEIVKTMTSEGKSAIFITHKMDEVMNFSDWVRVLQKGKLVSVTRTKDTNPKELANLMVGREVLFRIEKKECNPGDVRLELKNVSALNSKGIEALKDVSFELRSGEILGIAGVAGNGQRELTEVITGLHKVTKGQVFVEGKDMTNKSPIDLIKAGVSHIPSDRVAMGIVGDMSVASNLAMKEYRKAPLTQYGLLHPKRIFNMAKGMIELFMISTPSPHTNVKFLSGGNIQKTILAREIGACRGLLVAVYPARGLDVGATESVRKEIIAERDNGKAVLLVSEDLEELISVADKIAVMSEGEIMGIIDAETAKVESLGLMMAGVSLEESGAKGV
ncbi:MAG: ABC transporter ATP-binding protein [Spirochaetales bacterium]|nr:ABC transporter ATP-binding protein [Spirochaetales bacterium]